MRYPSERIKIKSIVSFIFLTIATLSNAQDLSILDKPTRYVHDYTNVLSAGDIEVLETKLARHADSARVFIYIFLLKSQEESKIQKVADQLFMKWNLDNGKNILVLAPDNHPMVIKPSVALKPSLSAITCNQIVLYTLMPSFKNKEYFEGLQIATSQLFGSTTGEYKQKYEKGNTSSAALLALIIFFIIFVLIPFAKYKVLQGNQVDGKPLNFFTAMMLMNLFGGKKASFSDFTKGKGQFGSFTTTTGGGGGSGNW